MSFQYLLNYLIDNNIALFGGIIRDMILSDNTILENINDIDCIMSEKQYEDLFNFLNKNKINFKFSGYNKEEYLPFEDPNNHIIEFSTIQIFNILIDIFVHKNNINIYDVMDTIVGINIDFYCNSLRYVNNKISISDKLINKFLKNNKNNIYYDINLEKNINIFLFIDYCENISFNNICNNIIVINNIINQIKNKIGLSIDKPDKHRIEKMLSKKWLII